MSFRAITQAVPRLNRSQLFVLANKPETFESAASSVADVVMFEIEDAVPPDQKAQARQNVIEALNDFDWGEKSMSMRINGLDTPYMYRDLVDILEAPTERLDLVLIPKAGNAADIYAVDVLVSQIEEAMGRKNRLGFQIMIETAQGMANIDEIAAASSRNDSLHLGENDYAASVRARMKVVGGANPDYHILTDADEDGTRKRHWGDMWHYAISRLVVAARANGLRPVDGPFLDPADTEGFRAAAMRAAVLGCEGKWGNDEPSMLLANEVFSPSVDDVAQARRVLRAAEDAASVGGGAATLDGKPVFMPQIRQAQALVAQADMIESKKTHS
ncbi:CoA ester lyase [uncultured Boseongicola sp.]|jgi:malyl-CoA/(S)-citramalyl-CoA lyase|uniref:HpcH/HpaI aldolase/citrate lyase family protein n=1 Tax=uncultured Boseongicola sp. TaxID=1648499 RepID=UPI00262588BC|nr:CoA ester lyase [uncultured Boseongicola sp.]